MSCWLFRCWLSWKCGWSKKYFRWLLLSWKQSYFLDEHETKFCVSLYSWSRIYSCWKLLYTTSLDEEATSCLWDFAITMCIFCDNTSAINLSKNPIQHSKSKHIEIRYHFIWDLVEDKVVCLEFIHTDNQKADIFTNPLDGPRFESLRKTIGVGTIPWISCVMCALFICLELITLV